MTGNVCRTLERMLQTERKYFLINQMSELVIFFKVLNYIQVDLNKKGWERVKNKMSNITVG